jgi:hypothetical protein
MRLLDALRHAMRMRRSGPDDLDAAGRWAAGETPGPEHRGLAELLAAAKAPARAEELAGRQDVVAAFAAAGHDDVVREPVSLGRRSRTARALVVNVTAGLVLLAGTGAAVAAHGGHLPDAAQQRAHDLFSRLGVPPPPSSPDEPESPPRTRPSRTSEPPSSGPSSKPAPPRPSASAPVAPAPAGWCRAWASTPEPGDAPWYRELVEAAGSEEEVAGYCAALDDPGTASAKPSHSRKPPGKPSSLPTPSHPGKK